VKEDLLEELRRVGSAKERILVEAGSERKRYIEQIEELEDELKKKQFMIYKLELAIAKATHSNGALAEEVERLKAVENIELAQLPISCFYDLKGEKEVKEAKEAAMNQAIQKLKKESQSEKEDRLLREIESLEKKQSTMYKSLYSQVSEHLGYNFSEKLKEDRLRREADDFKEEKSTLEMREERLKRDRMKL